MKKITWHIIDNRHLSDNLDEDWQFEIKEITNEDMHELNIVSADGKKRRKILDLEELDRMKEYAETWYDDFVVARDMAIDKLPVVEKSVGGVGHVNFTQDADGVYWSQIFDFGQFRVVCIDHTENKEKWEIHLIFPDKTWMELNLFGDADSAICDADFYYALLSGIFTAGKIAQANSVNKFIDDLDNKVIADRVDTILEKAGFNGVGEKSKTKLHNAIITELGVFDQAVAQVKAQRQGVKDRMAELIEIEAQIGSERRKMFTKTAEVIKSLRQNVDNIKTEQVNFLKKMQEIDGSLAEVETSCVANSKDGG